MILANGNFVADYTKAVQAALVVMRSRLDILIMVEQVVRVVLAFEFNQPLIITVIGSGYSPSFFFSHEVHISSRRCIWRGSFEEVSCPVYGPFIFCWRLPAGMNIENKFCISAAVGHSIRSDPISSSCQLTNKDLAVR